MKGGRRFQRDSQTRPRVATRARRGGVPAGHHPRFMGVRANLCVPGETCMAPASPSMARSHGVGPNPAGESGQRSRSVRPAIHHRKKRASLFLALSLFLPRATRSSRIRTERRRSTERRSIDGAASCRSRGEERARVALPRENRTKSCRG